MKNTQTKWMLLLIFVALVFNVEAANNDLSFGWLQDTIPSYTLDKEQMRAAIDGTKDKQKADRLYNKLAFKNSINQYRDLDDEQDKVMVAAKLANSYRLNNETFDAEYWYAKFVNDKVDRDHILHYAQMLQTNGKCKEAVKWYVAYNNKVAPNNRVGIEDCSAENNIKVTEDVEVLNITSINTKELDFAAIPFQDGIMFTSNRGGTRMTKNTDSWTNKNFTDLFYSKKVEEGVYGQPEMVKGDVNGRFHDGVATFNGEQNQMFYSKNNSSGKNKEDHVDLKIYSAMLQKDKSWKEIGELSFNSNDFASCHPSVTADGNTLYFTSDRPGGFGGMDIYMSNKVGETWTTPQNLGSTINSPADEIFPNIGTDGVLYFASNGHPGLGGLDIFAAKKIDVSDESTWQVRENLGKPFNTKRDDFCFYMNADQTQGYLTSTRRGGTGEDDIYEWKTSTPLKVFDKNKKQASNANALTNLIHVYEEDTELDMEGVIVSVVNIEDEKASQWYTTDKKGDVTMNVVPGTKMKLIIEKPGYDKVIRKMDAVDILTANKTIEIPLTAMNCTELTGTVMNTDCDKPLTEADITLVNKCTGQKEKIKTDENGEFDYCLKCGCEYEVMASKTTFSTDQTQFTTIKNNCKLAKPISTTLKIGTVKKTTPPKPTPTKPAPTRSAPPKKETTKILESLTGNSNTTLKAGQLIRLKNIYYDYNKFYIRADAMSDLDKVVSLMRTYPSMHIELGSHTDNRGRSEYNASLSQKRAQAALDYIANKGISRARMTAKGYGESTPLNRCKDGVNCSKSEYQLNRRTEIRITKIDADVKVEYQN